MRRLRSSFMLACLAALLAVAVAAPNASAQVRLVTDFPGLYLSAGETKSISLTLLNESDTGQIVDLALLQVPEGWEAVLKGRGMQVHRAYVGPREDNRAGRTSLTLEVEVPSGTPAGDYPLVVRAGNDQLQLNFRITEGTSTPGRVELTTQYPRLRGPAGAEFRFPINLANRSEEDQTFQFVVDAPRGWQVQISPRFEDRQLASIGVNAGATERLEAKVIPAQRAEAGEYPIHIRATAPGMSEELQLVVDITGTYELRMGTPTGRLNADLTAGSEGTVQLVLQNTGTADLHNISLSGTAPPNWSVSFNPERIDRLEAGQTREVTATLRPAERAIAGDYVVVVRASSPEADASSSLRVTVHTPTTWGWVGAGVVAAVLIGLLGTFRVYGRR